MTAISQTCGNTTAPNIKNSIDCLSQKSWKVWRKNPQKLMSFFSFYPELLRSYNWILLSILTFFGRLTLIWMFEKSFIYTLGEYQEASEYHWLGYSKWMNCQYWILCCLVFFMLLVWILFLWNYCSSFKCPDIKFWAGNFWYLQCENDMDGRICLTSLETSSYVIKAESFQVCSFILSFTSTLTPSLLGFFNIVGQNLQ